MAYKFFVMVVLTRIQRNRWTGLLYFISIWWMYDYHVLLISRGPISDAAVPFAHHWRDRIEVIWSFWFLNIQYLRNIALIVPILMRILGYSIYKYTLTDVVRKINTFCHIKWEQYMYIVCHNIIVKRTVYNKMENCFWELLYILIYIIK